MMGSVGWYFAILTLTLGAGAMGLARAWMFERERAASLQQRITAPAVLGMILQLAPTVAHAENAADARYVLADEPLWAYGYLRPPLPGETATPQLPPSRALRLDLRARPSSCAPGPWQAALAVIRWSTCATPMTSPTGMGRPENAPVAGLPVAYFLRQLEDFRNGSRRSAEPRKRNTPTMIASARALSDDEARAAAEYFAALPAQPWIRVVETDVVPSIRLAGNLFIATGDDANEPIAGRILEVPENEEQSINGTGTTADGQPIPGVTVPCGSCHGATLRGVGDIPAIAGRSPSYLVRQLYDMRSGARAGAGAQAMKAVVQQLTPAQMTDIAAYLVSLAPATSPRFQ